MQHELYDQREHFFLKLSPTVKGALYFIVALGLTTFIVGLSIGESNRTWGSFIFNLMFFFSIALGGPLLGSMQDVVGAHWGRPIKRLHESFSAFLPVAAGFIVFFLICIRFHLFNAHLVYSWVADPESIAVFEGKKVWLTPTFMFVRDVLSLAVILFLVRWHMKNTLRGDLLMLAGKPEESVVAAQKAKAELRFWSAPVMFAYAVAFSILVFDLTMSLAPTWFSTLWGGWSFSVLMQTTLASTLLSMFILKNSSLGQYIGRSQFHDIGKLLFGFTVFFAYLTYSHILTYWYTNIPEETSYFITRMKNPWLPMILAAPFLSFLFPFLLLIPKASKWTAFVAIPVCLVVLGSQWMNAMLVVIPEVVDGSHWSFPWIELGLFFGFLGLFLMSFFKFMERVPMLSISDPILHASMHQHH